jgi:hypothetical protein
MFGVAQLAGRTVGSSVVMWLSRGTRETPGRGGGVPTFGRPLRHQSLLTGRHASELRDVNLPAGLEWTDRIKGRPMDPASSIGEVVLALRHHRRISHVVPKGA